MQANPQAGKQFYFFEYFYILLKSVSNHSNQENIFDSFKILKQKFLLGESKYKKLTIEGEDLTVKKIRRYEYTFQQVISETSNYNLIKIENENERIHLTTLGVQALELFEQDKHSFNRFIFNLMESKHYVFYQLVNLCYKANKSRNGLLIFPIYSPRKLGFIKSEMTKNRHILNYSKALVKKLESDLKKYTGYDKKLQKYEEILLNKLVTDGLLSKNKEAPYNVKKYNTITTRFRKFWLNYFLRHVYKYNHSFSTFNIWVERGKQLGIIHTTEFYPNFDGRLVFPTSIIAESVRSTDFDLLFEYKNQTGEKLFIHKPDWNKKIKGHNASAAQETFVKQLVESYFDLKKSRRTHFIRLPDLREKVCYKMRIPSFIFDSFLEKTYMLNIKGEMILKVQISLEADRLPQENNAMYLRREPVLINGKYKNIIAIDYQKK